MEFPRAQRRGRCPRAVNSRSILSEEGRARTNLEDPDYMEFVRYLMRGRDGGSQSILGEAGRVSMAEEQNVGGDAAETTAFNNGGQPWRFQSEVDGLSCPICKETWTSSGDHRICCLSCGHVYGMSCIRQWLQRSESSGKCPLCNSVSSLNDIRVLYTPRIAPVDEELQQKILSLEAKCDTLENKIDSVATSMEDGFKCMNQRFDDMMTFLHQHPHPRPCPDYH